MCYFKKINEKQNKNIYRWLYYIPNIKLKIMLYEPFMFNMVWKSTESFGYLSLEKYEKCVGTLQRLPKHPKAILSIISSWSSVHTHVYCHDVQWSP